MKYCLKYFYLSLTFLLFLLIFSGPAFCINHTGLTYKGGPTVSMQDSIEKQILYNGRVWINIYGRVTGNPFLLSDEFLNGTVSVGAKTFDDIDLMYNIHTDELLTMTELGVILQLNKEIVDSFTLDYNKRTFLFHRFDVDTLNGENGYFRVLYQGKTSLYVRYKKVILLLAVDKKYDTFEQSHKIFIKKDGILHTVKSKKALLSFLGDRKQEINGFIKENKLKLSKNNPESFVPVIEFYNKSGY